MATDTESRATGLGRPSPYDPLAGISEATLHRQIKDHFDACSVLLAAAGDRASAARLAKASTH